MIQLAYLSSTKELLTAEELAELLETSRRNNQLQDITGLLLYKSGNVLQVLEGEREEVLKLFRKIGKDERHHNIVRLYEKAITSREFPQWTMGFQDLSGEGAAPLASHSEFSHASFELKGLKPSDAAKLVSVFRGAFA